MGSLDSNTSKGNKADPVSIVIETFNTAFENFELPACIAITDSGGLILHSVGACPELLFLEGMFGGFITTFEQMRTQLNKSFQENPRGLAIDFTDNAYYIYSILNTDLYLIARSGEHLLWRAIPFLKGICTTLDQINKFIEDEE